MLTDDLQPLQLTAEHRCVLATQTPVAAVVAAPLTVEGRVKALCLYWCVRDHQHHVDKQHPRYHERSATASVPTNNTALPTSCFCVSMQTHLSLVNDALVREVISIDKECLPSLRQALSINCIAMAAVVAAAEAAAVAAAAKCST
eukprot:1749-Heterococcus_DN1.PRE.5